MFSRFIFITVFALFLTASIIFYQFYISPHSNRVEDISALITAGTAAILFLALLFIPKSLSLLKGLILTFLAAVILVGATFWLIRPYQLIYNEVPERIEFLNEHLEEEHPERSWEIEHSSRDEDPIFTMLVTFEDEPDYEYQYYINRDVKEGEEPVESSGRQEKE
jgi:hypothetical protein